MSGLSFGGAPTPTVSVWVGTTEVTSTYNFPTGNTTVVVKAANGIGQDATCSFVVNVTDHQKPTITAPPAITAQPSDAGSCGAAKANVSLGTPTTGDNCGVQGTTNNAPAVFPIGTTTVTWTVTDVNGQTQTATQDVTVVDKSAPVISAVTQSVHALWPANHKMREVNLNYTVGDNCTAGLTYSVSVSSNEPTNGTGDGDTDVDWEVVNNHLVRVRAERASGGNGRIYTITIKATDAAGNETVKTVNVVVAHNIVTPVSGHAVRWVPR